MKKIIKKLVVLLIVLTILCAIMTKGTKAALQSNGDTPTQASVNDWMWYIRQMQATGETLGLTDTINTTNLTSGNKNLDIHMQKNTEYGAMILLGASQYGNSNKLNTNGVTTTGNKTGVVLKINGEWTAASMSNTESSTLASAAKRYKNIYDANYSYERKGDAIYVLESDIDLGSWHNGRDNIWLSGGLNNMHANRACVIRAYSGSAFSYYGWSYADRVNSAVDSNESYRGPAHYSKGHNSRAVVVVGSGV